MSSVDDDNDEDVDDADDDTTFISTCHSVRFDAPVSHICNCVYHGSNNTLAKRRAINCLAVAGRDGFIRIFESDAPFSSLFAFPIRYERVLSLDFLPKTSSFISIEHTADGSGNHVVIYEDWHRFPNLLKNVQVVEKGEDIVFNFVCCGGLPNNGYIAITAPGNMRLKSFQVEGINGESAFTFDVKIRSIQMSYDGNTIISSNTIVNAKDNDPNKVQYISHLDVNNDEERDRERDREHKKSTTYLVFELRTHGNIDLGAGAYRLSFPVAWKSRSRHRFRRELFGIEICDEYGVVMESAQQLWIMDSDTATAAAHGYTTHPRYGAKISVCAENIRCLRKSRYIEQMKIFELDRNNGNQLQNKTHSHSYPSYDEDQSWFPSDFIATTNDLNESVSCMNVCKESGRIVTCSKSLISIWDCDLIMRSFRIPHHNYIETDIDWVQQQKVSKYRLGPTCTKGIKKKIRQMITVRTPPLKILSLHASFIVRLVHIHCNYLAFASEHEMRMVYLDIKKETTKTTKTTHNVSVVFDDDGHPSMKHHSASFMLIPSIYEFNRLSSPSASSSLDNSIDYCFEMIGEFADHAHRIDLSSCSNTSKLIHNVVILESNTRTTFDTHSLNYAVIEKEILDRSHAMFEINNISMIVHKKLRTSIRIRTLQIVAENALLFLLLATDDQVFVYDLAKRTLSYSLGFAALNAFIIEAYLYNTFLFVLTEKNINVYSSSPTKGGHLLLLWRHPLLRMRGLKILPANKFCLEFGSQTEMDRFSVNADGRRIRSHPFDLRSRLQYPTDPDKRPLTIFEENSPKNILIFEWAETSEMVLSLITKSHEAITTKMFERSRHLLMIALELIKTRESHLYPLYESMANNAQNNAHNSIQSNGKKADIFGKSLGDLLSSAWNWMNVNVNTNTNTNTKHNLHPLIHRTPHKSVIQSEWHMLKQLKKECDGLLADVYVMQNKYDIAAQHYILSNRPFLQITQLFTQHIHKYADAHHGLTLFYRLFLKHKSRIDHELKAYTWNNIMQHFKTFEKCSFPSIFLHPYMLNTNFNVNIAIEWLDECMDECIAVEGDGTHYLAKVVLLCLNNDIEAAQGTLCLIQSRQFIVLLQSHKRLWLEWSHCMVFRKLCSVTFPWEFARIVLDYAIVCYDDLRTGALQSKSDASTIATSSDIEQLFPFPLRTLSFNESLEYFEYQSGGSSLMQCYLEGAVRYLVQQIDDFETIQMESNRSLPERDNALYMKYLAELEEIGFTLIELYVRYLQKVCYDDTTNILMHNINDNGDDQEEVPTERAGFEEQRDMWNAQYPVISRPIPPWLNQLLEHKHEEEEKEMVITRICTLLSCIELGASIKKREKVKEKEKGIDQWKRRLDLLLASCPDIPHKYVNAITITGYVSCDCISDAIHIILSKEQSIITEFALTYCKSLNDWSILLQQILELIAICQQNENEKELQYLQDSVGTVWRHLTRLSSLSTNKSEWLSVMDLISLVPDEGNLAFFAPIFSDLCRNQAGDALNMELFDRIVQIEKDKDYGFNQQMHEIFYPQHDE